MPNSQQWGDNHDCQLKAGHPPAVKVGNMRIAQRTQSSSSTSDKNDEEKSGNESSSVPAACSFAPKTIIKTATSGVPDNMVQSFPEAVKNFHEKPQVTHEFRFQRDTKPNLAIQQPKK